MQDCCPSIEEVPAMKKSALISALVFCPESKYFGTDFSTQFKALKKEKLRTMVKAMLKQCTDF